MGKRAATDAGDGGASVAAEELPATPTTLAAAAGMGVDVGGHHAQPGPAAGSSGALTPSGAPVSASAVWAYFEKDALGNSVCKFCDRVIKGHHSSNLLSHLRTAGRTDPAHQQANAVCEEHRESKRHIKRQKIVGQAAAAAVDFAAFPGAAGATQLAAAVAAAASAGTASPSLLAAALKRDGSFFGYSPLGALAKEQREAFSVQTPTTQAPVAAVSINQDQLTQDLALMALVDNLPADLSTRPGMQYVLGQLLGDKRPPFPTEEAITKSMLMLQESMFLTTKMVLARAKSVRLELSGGGGCHCWY